MTEEEEVKSVGDIGEGILPTPEPTSPESKIAAKKAGPKEIRADDKSVIVETRKNLKRQKTVKIMIASTESDKEPVDVGINGWTYRIARDVEVEVPESVVEVLNNAKYTTYTSKDRGSDGEGIEMVPSVVSRFPMQIVR